MPDGGPRGRDRVPARLALPATANAGRPTGWGPPLPATDAPDAPDAASRTVVDVAVTPDARIGLDDWSVAVAAIDAGVASPDGRISIRAATGRRRPGRPSGSRRRRAHPARVRFVAADGRYLPPLGHREEINPGLFEDTGAGAAPRRGHVRVRPGRRSRSTCRSGRSRSRSSRASITGPCAGPLLVEAGTRDWRSRSSGRSTCAARRLADRRTPTSTSWPRRPPCSRRPPRTSCSSTCWPPSSATSSRT